MTKKLIDPRRKTLGLPLASGAIDISVTGPASLTSPEPGSARTVTAPPWRTRVPANAGALPAGSTTRFRGPLPKRLSPSSSQNSPTSVSQPFESRRLESRAARQLSISRRYASGLGAARAAAGEVGTGLPAGPAVPTAAAVPAVPAVPAVAQPAAVSAPQAAANAAVAIRPPRA